MFTNNCRDEVTLIFLKHKYRRNAAILGKSLINYEIRLLVEEENVAIRDVFSEVRDRNALDKQAGSYEAVAEQCEEFFKSTAEEKAS